MITYETVHSAVLIFFSSMIPMISSHGSVILAAALGAPWDEAFVLSTAGSFSAALVFLHFDRERLEALRKFSIFDTFFSAIDGWLERSREKIEKHACRSLALFLGMPFTGVGVLAGCIIAKILDIEPKKARIAIFIGIALNCFITTAAVYGLLTGLRTIIMALF